MNALLQALVNGEPPAKAGESPLSPKPVIRKLRYNHQAMIELLVAEPWLSQNALADIFDRSPSWISTIICSDVFQDQLAKRREEVLGPEVLASYKTQHEGLMLRSMAILREKLNKPAEEVTEQLALQVLKVTGANLGLAKQGETKVSIHETHVHLEDLGKNLVGLLRRQRVVAEETIDGEVTPASGPHHDQQGAGPSSEGQAQLPAPDQARLARTA